jgi:thiamine biosynthesis lipoprotein
LSRLNAAEGAWLEIPADFCSYLERARSAAVSTRGHFDISVGGLAQGGLAAVGSDGIECECDRSPPRARLTRPQMALDPGGDGKGVALDAAVALLREAGVRSALLDFGGSSWVAVGQPPQGPAWRVRLVDSDEVALGELLLRDASLSISATTQRGSDSTPHILDPRSGELLRASRWAAVVAPTATEAEVLSTALIVAGESGLSWLIGPGRAALLRSDGVLHRAGKLELAEPAE